MKVSILIPCHNEEDALQACIESCLHQTRPIDEIVVVDDGSTDGSARVLAGYWGRIKVVTLARATGNKSYAQEAGLPHVTGDVFITTDADTMLDSTFVERIICPFADVRVAAVSGYIKSIRHNWLTALRELDYFIDQELLKRVRAAAQAIEVLPGCAAAFRTDAFRRHVSFDHDTITEDRDFTFKLHTAGYRIAYERRAIVHTQDPATLGAYVRQLRRWYGGSWQNVVKHRRLLLRIENAPRFLSSYVFALGHALLLCLSPLVAPRLGAWVYMIYMVWIAAVGLYAWRMRRRSDLVSCLPLACLTLVIKAWVYLEQFILQIVLRKRDHQWYRPPRRRVRYDQTRG